VKLDWLIPRLCMLFGIGSLAGLGLLWIIVLTAPILRLLHFHL